MAPWVFMPEGPVLAPASRASQSLNVSKTSGNKGAWNARMYQDLCSREQCEYRHRSDVHLCSPRVQAQPGTVTGEQCALTSLDDQDTKACASGCVGLR